MRDEVSLAGLSLAPGSRQQGETEQQAILDSSVRSPSTPCLSFPPAVAEHPLSVVVWALLPWGLGGRLRRGCSSPVEG